MPDEIRCPQCGFEIPELVEQHTEHHKEVIGALEHQLVKQRKALQMLQRLLTDKRDTHKFRSRVELWFHYWRAACAPKARALNGARFDAAAARLSEVPAVELDERMMLGYRAIDGAAARPFISDGGRRGSEGTKDQRSVDMELIFRSEAHLMRFASYAPDVLPSASPLADLDGQLEDARRQIGRAVEYQLLPDPDLLERRAVLVRQHHEWDRRRHLQAVAA